MTKDSVTTFTPEELFKKARSLAAQLRRTGRYPATMIFSVLQEVYSAGYAEAHEHQMKARILDAKDYREKIASRQPSIGRGV